jgi:hypothetical protein
VRRQSEELIVNFDVLYRADQNAAAWDGSTVQVA